MPFFSTRKFKNNAKSELKNFSEYLENSMHGIFPEIWGKMNIIPKQFTKKLPKKLFGNFESEIK